MSAGSFVAATRAATIVASMAGLLVLLVPPTATAQARSTPATSGKAASGQATSGQASPAVIRPSATLGPAASPPGKGDGARGSAQGGNAQGGSLAPGAASSGPPVFSHRGLPHRFRSVAHAETVLFDAPSDKARKLYIAPAGMPVEIISMLRDWVKFRDSEGDLSWVNREALTDRRTVVTTAPATMRREPRDEAEPILDADQGVLFELLDDRPTGTFARVRHAGGEIGYLPTASLWGM